VLKHNDKVVTLSVSYESIVGVEYNYKRYVSINEWSTTTGKFLNELERNHDLRIPHSEVLTHIEMALNWLLSEAYTPKCRDCKQEALTDEENLCDFCGSHPTIKEVV
jgi:hypothetical protein